MNVGAMAACIAAGNREETKHFTKEETADIMVLAIKKYEKEQIRKENIKEHQDFLNEIKKCGAYEQLQNVISEATLINIPKGRWLWKLKELDME